MVTLPDSQLEDTLSIPVDEKGFVTESDRDSVLRRLRSKLENRQCFDCQNRNPTWLSVTYGIFLDKFTPEQLLRMKLGGNGKAFTFFKTHGCNKVDYNSKLAAKYRQQLNRQIQLAMGDAKTTPASSLEMVDGPVYKIADSHEGSSRQKLEAQEVKAKSANGLLSTSAPIPAVADILPHAEKLPPITKATRMAKAAPQVYESIKISGGLGGALMHQASGGGGVGAVKAKSRRLDFDFDFDEAVEEAAAPAPIEPSLSPPLYKFASSSTPPTVINPANDANLGLFPFNNTTTSAENIESGSQSSAGLLSHPKFANATALSSAELFGERDGPQTGAEKLELEARIRRFNDCKAISSDAFFAGDPYLLQTEKNHPFEDETTAQLSYIGEQARQKVQMLTSGAQQSLSKARDWINTFIFEEKNGNSFR